MTRLLAAIGRPRTYLEPISECGIGGHYDYTWQVGEVPIRRLWSEIKAS